MTTYEVIFTLPPSAIVASTWLNFGAVLMEKHTHAVSRTVINPA